MSKMFGLKKTITIFACLLGMHLSLYTVYASKDITHEADNGPIKKKRTMGPLERRIRIAFNRMPSEYYLWTESLGQKDNNVIMIIFDLVLRDGQTEPGNLRLVCKKWKTVLDLLLINELRGYNYMTSSPLRCYMLEATYGGLGQESVYWRFTHARLWYRRSIFRYDWEFACLKNPFNGTFDLLEKKDPDLDDPELDQISPYVRITTSVDEFFKDTQENTNKVVILIGLYYSFQKTHYSKFKYVKRKHHWCPSKPYALFWRWGNDSPLMSKIDSNTDIYTFEFKTYSIGHLWRLSDYHRIPQIYGLGFVQGRNNPAVPPEETILDKLNNFYITF